MEKVRAKKHLGQHFLKDLAIAQKIAESLTGHKNYTKVLEIGPGMGVLTQFLIPKYQENLHLVEIDRESIPYLHQHYPQMGTRLIEGDFLRLKPTQLPTEPYAVIGNFPYNISSQIFFKVLENRALVPEVVGMIQKEVAERLAARHGNKQYGILSVLLQTFYKIEYLFTVHEHVFSPPPKVKSAVIRFTRNEREQLPCSEKLLFQVVKQAFNTRRKTLRNALKSLSLPDNFTSEPIFNLRAEQLSVEDFISLTTQIEKALASKSDTAGKESGV